MGDEMGVHKRGIREQSCVRLERIRMHGQVGRRRGKWKKRKKIGEEGGSEG